MMEKDRAFDKIILERLRGGDESALKSLFDYYYMPLCVYSVQFTDSLEVSEDLVQELFISFWERKAYLIVGINLRAYLFNGVRNLSLNYLKKERPYALQDIEDFLSLSDEEEEEEYTEAKINERRQKLYSALKELSPQEYKVLYAIVFENKKYKEVAEELEISVNSVKTYLSRAFKFLRSKSLLSILFQVAY